MDLSPTFDETETETFLGEVGLFPILAILFMVIATVLFLIKGRTPAFIAVVFFWPAAMIGAYIIILVGFSWPLFIIVLMIILSAIAIWKGLKDERFSPYIAGVVIIGVFFFATLFLGGGAEVISEEIGDNGEIPSIPLDDPGGFVEVAFGDFGTFMLIILVGGILAFLLVQRVIPIIRSSTEKREDEEKLEDQFTSTVDSAVTELREGKDVHSTILRCYQRMCMILEEKGAKNFEFMTPREFEEQAIRTLNVSASKISEIREVFELAKYSNYRLGEEERDRAVKALKELRKELE